MSRKHGLRSSADVLSLCAAGLPPRRTGDAPLRGTAGSAGRGCGTANSAPQTLSGPGIAYTGPTTVTQGTLKMADATAFASAITNSAAVELQATCGQWTFGEVIAGTGAFTKTGAARSTTSWPPAVHTAKMLRNGRTRRVSA
ncbi:MAG: hypothetical protein FJ288_11805 [Planctomycetes bacterium]|nr:hypothetical protein [Planctomycetota bacterium]